MRRPLAPDDVRIWSLVTATVRPKGTPTPTAIDRAQMKAASEVMKLRVGRVTQPVHQGALPRPGLSNLNSKSQPASASVQKDIEPGRRRRISRSRDPIGARLDLHGMDEDRARSAVLAFVAGAAAEGLRTVLIITGKGTRGDGVLRRRAPEWLSDIRIRPMIAGFSFADRHHGGEGALYVALKRPKP